MKRLQSNSSNHPGLWTYNNQQAEVITPNVVPPSLSAALEAAVHSIGQRWITVIGGQASFVQQLVNAGIPRQRIRWLRPGKTDAIAHGHSNKPYYQEPVTLWSLGLVASTSALRSVFVYHLE